MYASLLSRCYEAELTPLSNSKVKKAWNYSSTHSYRSSRPYALLSTGTNLPLANNCRLKLTVAQPIQIFIF
jgi:hypothetical protein